MAKRKSTKGQTTIYKTYTKKLCFHMPTYFNLKLLNLRLFWDGIMKNF